MVRRTYSAQAWERLGLVISAARNRAGYEETRGWASAVGRSGRVLLGLERGEPVGKNTLRRIEEVLGWDVGEADAVLEGKTPTAASVTTHPTLRALGQDEIVLGPGDALAAIENDPLLADQAKIHLLNQYRLLLFVPPSEPGGMSAPPDRTTPPSRAVAKHGDPADREAVHRIAQEVRDAYEEELRRRRTGEPNG